MALGKEKLDQIEDYAMTVTDNPTFDKAVIKWHFILLGQDFKKYVVNKLKNRTQGTRNYYNSEDSSVSISALKWSSVIQENKFKLEFLRKKLNHQLDDNPNFASDYLLARHAELFPPAKKRDYLNTPPKKAAVETDVAKICDTESYTDDDKKQTNNPPAGRAQHNKAEGTSFDVPTSSIHFYESMNLVNH